MGRCCHRERPQSVTGRLPPCVNGHLEELSKPEDPHGVPGGGGWEGWGVLSKLVRPPTVVPGGGGWGGLGYPVQTGRPSWRFLGEAAGSIVVSGLNWRDPHGGSWGRWLGGLGSSV